MSKLRDSSGKSEADGISNRDQGGIMGSTNRKAVTLRKSASTFLQRKPTSRKTPTRASTLPAAPSALKKSKESSASMLLPTNLCENPRKILQEVADYFSQGASDEVRSISDGCSSASLSTCNSGTPSPLGDTTPSTESSSSRRNQKPYDVHSETSPWKPRPIRARSHSEPTRKHKSTPFAARFSCYSSVDLTSLTLNTPTINSFNPLPPLIIPSPPIIKPLTPLIPRFKASPLSREVVCQHDEIEIDIQPDSRTDCPSQLAGLRTKNSEKEPQLVTRRNSKFQKSTPKGGSTAKEILHRGITAHQKNDMILSAILFEQCAKGNGECGVGMLMWALALRHGWGCPVDTTKAFGWLQLSIETLLRELHLAKIEKQRVEELQNFKRNPENLLASHSLLMEIKGITSELLLALYELGQCLMYGWGCERDNTLAVQYYLLAANLGDPDAQKGKGVHSYNRLFTKT